MIALTRHSITYIHHTRIRSHVILLYLFVYIYIITSASTFQDFHLHTDCFHRNSAMEPITSKNTWRLTLPKVNPKRGPTRFIKYSNPRPPWNSPNPRRSMTPETKWRKYRMTIRRRRIYYIILYMTTSPWWPRVHDDHDFLFFYKYIIL